MKRFVILIIGLGFLARLFCFKYTYVINPDGVIYIHQARALYHGLWDSVNSCEMSYLSVYPLLMVPFYKIFGDWVTASKSVSLFFGTMALVPLYFLSRRFFERSTSALVLLVFAVMPFFIHRSVDVVRGPVFWFFSLLGFYLFLSRTEKRDNVYLVLSNLSFLMAAWARVEALLFIIVSCLYLLAVEKGFKIRKFFVFLSPALALFLVGATWLAFDLSYLNVVRYNFLTKHLSEPFAGYERLREGLAKLQFKRLGYVKPYYMEWIRQLAWFNALGMILICMVETLFYPFFLIFVIGVPGAWRRIKTDKGFLCLIFAAAGAFVILYMFALNKQTISHRYMALLVLPCFIFIAFGLERIMAFFRGRFRLREHFAIPLLCLLILGCSLPKGLKPREKDKLVFQEIGEFIANREGNNREIQIASPKHSLGWVSFYANLNYKGAPCPLRNYDFWRIAGRSYHEFLKNLKKRDIGYFLYSERYWPKRRFDFMKKRMAKDFLKIKKWSHPDTGRLILFEVNPKRG